MSAVQRSARASSPAFRAVFRAQSQPNVLSSRSTRFAIESNAGHSGRANKAIGVRFATGQVASMDGDQFAGQRVDHIIGNCDAARRPGRDNARTR